MKKLSLELRWPDPWIRDLVIGVILGLLVIWVSVQVEESDEGGPSGWSRALTLLGTIVVTLVIAIRKKVGEIQIAVREHNADLAAEDEIDNLLIKLQTSLRVVRLHRSAVFKTYCKQELESFVIRVAKAAQGELIVNEHHFSTLDDVLEAFGRQGNQVYRGVWVIEEGERLFDTSWQIYMRKLIELAESPRETEKITVELLFVVDKPETLDRLALKVVVGYLRAKKMKGIKYCIITKEIYGELVSDGNLDTKYIDFGVYGEELLYRTESYEPKQGMFSEDTVTIRAYRRTHETAMKSANALPDPTGTEDHIDLERFLRADEVEEEEGRGDVSSS